MALPNTSGRWDEASVDMDLPFVDTATKIINTAQTAFQVDKSQNIKATIKRELGPFGWEYNGRATLKAHFLSRRKYLVFDSTTNLHPSDFFRIKVVMSRDGISGYKFMKWVSTVKAPRELFESLYDLLATKKGRAILALIIVAFIALAIWRCN